MKHGVVYPLGSARDIAEAAQLAEECGWDGFFVWEPVWGIDAWVSLTAAAMITKKIKLGTMISPISRMRPWKLASETATLDNLSNGRVVLSVGLGATDTDWDKVGETTDRKIRAELLDESLTLLEKFWQAKPFTFEGKHYKVQEIKFYPPPSSFQKPRIATWVVGAIGYQKSLDRAYKYDGIIPTLIGKNIEEKLNVDHVKDLRAKADEKGMNSFDIILEGSHSSKDQKPAETTLEKWEQAGATWWIDGLWDLNDDPDPKEKVLSYIKKGPKGN